MCIENPRDKQNPNIARVREWGRFHLEVLVGDLEVHKTEKKKSRR
jgi:hypothetical protein